MCEIVTEQCSHHLGAQNTSNALKQCLDAYQIEVCGMESAVFKLGLLNVDGSLCGNTVMLDKLKDLQMKFNTQELSTNAICLSYSHNLSESDGYGHHIFKYTTILQKSNERIEKENTHLNRELEVSGSQIDQIPTIASKDLEVLKERAKRYQTELSKLYERHTWLKDTMFNLNKIDKKVNQLDELSYQKEELTKGLEKYHGLKPDLHEASKQIAEIKQKFDEITKKLTQQ